MTPAERQYRRVLRLLPAGYRQRWEEDMVSAYLDSLADSPRRSVGERLAVVWLALRLRLNGSHASPRARLWYQLALGFALLTTLYESLRATLSVAVLAWQFTTVEIDIRGANHVAYWWDVGSLVWVATFVCLVLGWAAVARVLVLIALAYELGLMALIVKYTLDPSWWMWPGMLLEYGNRYTIYQVWLSLTAVAVFLVPRGFRPSRGWLLAYAVPALVITPIAVLTVMTTSRNLILFSLGGETTIGTSTRLSYWLQPLQLLNVGSLLHVGLIVGMVIALVRARQWLLPLSVFGGGVAAVQLLGHYYGTDFLYELRQHGSESWTWVNVVQLTLAAACAVAGLIAVRGTGTGGRPATG